MPCQNGLQCAQVFEPASRQSCNGGQLCAVGWLVRVLCQCGRNKCDRAKKKRARGRAGRQAVLPHASELNGRIRLALGISVATRPANEPAANTIYSLPPHTAVPLRRQRSRPSSPQAAPINRRPRQVAVHGSEAMTTPHSASTTTHCCYGSSKRWRAAGVVHCRPSAAASWS